MSKYVENFEIRAVTRYLVHKGMEYKQIYREVSEFYGETAISEETSGDT